MAFHQRSLNYKKVWLGCSVAFLWEIGSRALGSVRVLLSWCPTRPPSRLVCKKQIGHQRWPLIKGGFRCISVSRSTSNCSRSGGNT
ncbi:uncharacterized [Tachysurus ichikawai]